MITEAIILSAGRGERMRPLTDKKPKPLQKIGKYTLIEKHIIALANAGVKHLIVNVAWLGDMIERCVGNGERFGVCIDYSREKVALGTLGGIVQALPLFKEDKFLVLSADIVTNFNFGQFLSSDKLDINDIAHLVLINESEFKGDFSLISGRVTLPQEKAYTYGNIGIFWRKNFESYKSGDNLDLGSYLKEAAKKNKISGQLFDGFWSNVGTIDELQRLNLIMSE